MKASELATVTPLGAPSAEVEAAQPPGRRLGDELPAAEGVARREHQPEHRRPRAAARGAGPGVAADEVADVDARRPLARLAQRERAGEVARDPVVAERGDEPAAGRLGGRPVALEDRADERALAGRVEVVRARGDRGLDGGGAQAHERPDGRDQHVPALDEAGAASRGRRRRRPRVSSPPSSAASASQARARCAPRAPGGRRGRRAHGRSDRPCSRWPRTARCARSRTDPILWNDGRAGPRRAPHRYDTSKPEALRAAAAFVKGWLEARDIEVRERDFDGLPVVMADVGAREGPTVILHGHLDVVPARDGPVRAARRGRPAHRPRRLRHEGRARVDDVRGPRGGRAGPGPRDVRLRPRRGVRGRRQPLDRRPRRRGPARRLRADRRADRPAHRRAGEGRARGPRRGVRGTAAHGSTPWLGDNAILKAHDAFRRIETLPFSRESSDMFDRPSINLAPHRGRRRVQQGPGHVPHGRRHPLPAQPGPGRRSSPRSARSPTCGSSRRSPARRRSSRAATRTCSRCATRSAARSRARR